MRVNLGCGMFPLDGWRNYDLHCSAPNIENADVRGIHLENVDEVAMLHLLEHLPIADVLPLLARVRGWLVPGGRLTVEVPDMRTICRWVWLDKLGSWETAIYGCQEHPGEFHYVGFTDASLDLVLRQAGFVDVSTRVFRSEHPARQGFPCLEAVCYVEGGDRVPPGLPDQSVM